MLGGGFDTACRFNGCFDPKRRRALKSTQQKHLSFSTVSLKRDVFLLLAAPGCLQMV